MLRQLFPGGPVYNLFAACSLIVAAAVGVLGITHVVQAAGDDQGPAWPRGSVIRYFNDTPWQRTLERAADKWNETGLKVRIEQTENRQDADVIVVADTKAVKADGCDDCVAKVDHIGRVAGKRTLLLLPTFEDDSRDDPPAVSRVRLASHEFGHILGLTHSTHGCAVMDPETGSHVCPISVRTDPDGFGALCGPLPSDLARVRAWYGPVSKSYSPYCDFLDEDESTVNEGLADLVLRRLRAETAGR